MSKMIIFRKPTFILFFIQIFNFSSFSQEVLNDLFVNPILVDKETPVKHKVAKAPLNLPFFDDFSTLSDYPSQELWIDNNVFVNANYPIFPPSIGVATFDAVDAHGFVYQSLSDFPSPADTLTSQIIDLSGANKSSTWLSFYYQPQGYGDAPEFNDSLILNFITPDSVYSIWFANGTDYKSFKEDTLKIHDNRPDTMEFRFVHLKLENPDFFTDNFQLQFINYVSIAGISNLSGQYNSDHWNIDYILLDDNRSESDTIFHDMAMVKPSSLFLKDYNSIPWSHFNDAIDKQLTDLSFYIRNNDSKVRSMNQLTINIKDLSTGVISDFYIGQNSLYPFENRSDLLWNFVRSPIEWYEADSAIFELKGELKTDEADYTPNNFTSRTIKFKDYYAYDDGTAEKAYGFDNSRVKVAYKYIISKGDSLRAVDIYFVRPKEEYNGVQSFTLCVWDDYNDTPGNIIIKESGKRPEYSNNLNEFVTINLDTTIYLEGTFYIGWQQTSDLLMNVGFDANTVKKNRLYYYENSQWNETKFKGSLMMRPVFGEGRIANSVAESVEIQDLLIAPNPSNGSFRIITESELSSGSIQIFNYLGKQVFSKQTIANEQIDVTHLIDGMYIVNYIPQKGTPKSIRLIIKK